MEKLEESEAFCTGIAVGISIYQQKVITAHKREKPLIVGDNLYYLQDSRERLQEVMDKICK